MVIGVRMNTWNTKHFLTSRKVTGMSLSNTWKFRIAKFPALVFQISAVRKFMHERYRANTKKTATTKIILDVFVVAA